MTFTESTPYRIFRYASAAERGRNHPLVEKLRSFGNLPNGWSLGEGTAVTEDAIRIAEGLVDVAIRLQLKADVFPGLHGNCAVAFYHGEKSVEVIVPSRVGNDFELHVEEGSGFQFRTLLQKNDASHVEVLKHISDLVPDVWMSPVSSRYVNSTHSSADFQMSSSSTPPERPLELQTAS